MAKWLQNYTDVKKTASLGELYNNLANDFLDVTTKDDSKTTLRSLHLVVCYFGFAGLTWRCSK